MMKVTLRISSLLFVLITWSTAIWAQPPVNDKCTGAIELMIYDSEAEAIRVSGDTRNTTDGALDNIPVCSANFYRDDVWYYVTAPTVVSESGYAIRVYYTDLVTDIPGFGLALYNSCEAVAANEPFFCGNADPTSPFYWDDYGLGCFGPDQTVYIRVWSADGDVVNWQNGAGTFRIAIFPREYLGSPNAVVLWGDQPGQGDFDGGLNGWTAQGISCTGTGPENALWEWSDSGWPYWLFAGNRTSRIKSKTLCNGVMLFESMFLDIGPDNIPGSGTCPQVHEGALVSPVIDLSGFDSDGISVVFNQSMQRFTGGLHFVDYRFGGDTAWTAIRINADKTALTSLSSNDAGYYNEEFRVRLPGAENASDLQIRFRFQGEAYWWIIDDVRIVELECNNMTVQSNFFAIQPWAQIPSDQVREFAALADIYNSGACTQDNVVLTFTVIDTTTGTVMYNRSLDYGSLTPDTLAQNKLFPELVDLPMVPATYLGTYTVTSSALDALPADNSISFYFTVGGNVFAHEDGWNTGAAVNDVLYDDNAPLSFAYGNIFRPMADATVDRIIWGAVNPGALPGKSVSIYLLEWEDSNGNLIAENLERRYVALGDYTFTGNEGDNAIIETIVEDINDPSDPVIMRAGFQYMAVVESVAVAGDPSLILLASNARDYSAQVLAMDSAFTHGLAEDRLFMTTLGFSPDGFIANIDYEVRELDVTDNRVFFGDNLVPLIRIVVNSVNTEDELPLNNHVSIFPNPATDEVRVKLEFSNPYGDVQLRLINPLGQVVYQKSLNAVITDHTELISVRELTAGNYMLQVETPDGQRSIPVVVVK